MSAKWQQFSLGLNVWNSSLALNQGSKDLEGIWQWVEEHFLELKTFISTVSVEYQYVGYYWALLFGNGFVPKR